MSIKIHDISQLEKGILMIMLNKIHIVQDIYDWVEGIKEWR